MKLDEAVVRIMTGIVAGAAMGFALAAASVLGNDVVPRGLGIVILLLLFGGLYVNTPRAKLLMFALLVAGVIFAVFRGGVLLVWLNISLSIAGILGKFIINATASSPGTALIMWAIVGAIFNLSMGLNDSLKRAGKAS